MTLALDRPATAPADARATAREIDDLVRAHLPLVGHLVREAMSRVPAHVSRDELVSAGMYALATSARNFDPTVGASFASFASIRIRGAVTDELRTMDWASRSVRGKARELETTRQELTHLLGRTPRHAEIAHTMGISAADLSGIKSDTQRAQVLSLQAIGPDTSDGVLPSNAAGPEALLVRREQLGYLRDAVAELPERLRTVVEQYFFQQRKMTEIAAELGVTESRVSQLRSEALVMLRLGMQAADAETATPEDTAGARAAARRAYRESVATRSSVAGRLAATTVLGESRPYVTLPLTS